MRRHMNRRKAAILTLFVFLLPVLIIMLGFCIDMSYMQLVQTEMRLATDNAARAAADNFARFENEAQARNAGKRMARNFQVAGQNLRLRNNAFDFGRAEMTESGAFAFNPTGTPPNAVRINTTRNEDSRDGSVRLFFSNWVGRGNYQPSSSSTAAFLNVDICLVLDRSTSMKNGLNATVSGMLTTDPRFCQPPAADTRWLALESAVQEFVSVLSSNTVDEMVSIVTYGSDIDTVQLGLCGREPASTLDLPLTSTLADVNAEVNRRSGAVWNGNTLIESGIRRGTTELTSGSTARQYSEKVMIVLTDGIPTGGDAVAGATAARAAGIRVYTITFGDEADQAHMQSVAAAGGGSHAHASTDESLETVFREFAAAATRLVQ